MAAACLQLEMQPDRVAAACRFAGYKDLTPEEVGESDHAAGGQGICFVLADVIFELMMLCISSAACDKY